MIHFEKLEMHVYCDIKAETVVCTHQWLAKRGHQCCVLIPALPFQEKLLILSFIMFISLKLEQMINLVLCIRLRMYSEKSLILFNFL